MGTTFVFMYESHYDCNQCKLVQSLVTRNSTLNELPHSWYNGLAIFGPTKGHISHRNALLYFDIKHKSTAYLMLRSWKTPLKHLFIKIYLKKHWKKNFFVMLALCQIRNHLQGDISVVGESPDFQSRHVNLPIVWDCVRWKSGPCLSSFVEKVAHNSTLFPKINATLISRFFKVTLDQRQWPQVMCTKGNEIWSKVHWPTLLPKRKATSEKLRFFWGRV